MIKKSIESYNTPARVGFAGKKVSTEQQEHLRYL